MGRKHSQKRFSVGELVDAAYEEAGRLTRDSQLAALLANKVLEELLSHSDRPDLLDQLRSAAA